MRKLYIIIFMLLAGSLFAQNSSDWEVRYYGDGESKSDSLRIADAAAESGEYVIPNSGIIIAVDSNWTASGIGFKVYNYLEEVWELVYDEDGVAVEYAIAVGAPVRLRPTDVAGLKIVKFTKITSGSEVNQSGSASSLQVATIRIN